LIFWYWRLLRKDAVLITHDQIIFLSIAAIFILILLASDSFAKLGNGTLVLSLLCEALGLVVWTGF